MLMPDLAIVVRRAGLEPNVLLPLQLLHLALEPVLDAVQVPQPALQGGVFPQGLLQLGLHQVELLGQAVGAAGALPRQVLDLGGNSIALKKGPKKGP